MDTYIYQADIYCEDCGKEIIAQYEDTEHADDGDSDTYPQGPYSDAGGESDTPQHCGSHADCLNAHTLDDGSKIGVFLENPLTSDGIDYVVNSHRDRPTEVTQMWVDYYDLADRFETDDDDELLDVAIPSEYLELCEQWYSGQDDMMYAVSSTGGLSLGTRRPWNEDGDPMTDREWHVYLWDNLECDVRAARKGAEKTAHEDTEALRRFEAFCEETANHLRVEYCLED